MSKLVPRGVALGGFMASGKSTVGPLLAERLGLPFVDLDQALETAEGVTIEQIFASEGEEAFRTREQAMLRKVVSDGPSVWALGGGTLHQPGWREVLNGVPRVILQASWPVLRERINADDTPRPLAIDGEALYLSRQAGYKNAGFVVSVDGLSPEEVVEAVMVHLCGGLA